jgi:hypothetical protein
MDGQFSDSLGGCSTVRSTALCVDRMEVMFLEPLHHIIGREFCVVRHWLLLAVLTLRSSYCLHLGIAWKEGVHQI